MNPIRVLIVDDEPLAREGIRGRLALAGGFEVAGECSTGPRAVERIRQGDADLVFLDVQIPQLDGFEVIERVGAARMPEVIFVTAYDEHALRAFRVRALDYLLKPIDGELFAEALRRARERILRTTAEPPRPVTRLSLATPERGVVFLETAEIEWIEAADNYVRLHARDGRVHLLHTPLHALAARLGPAGFARIHRSRIVNLTQIAALRSCHHGEYEFTLVSGARILSGRRYRERVRRLLDEGR